MKMNCLIIDDEPLSIKLIKDYLLDLDEFNIVGEARNAYDAVKILEKETIDLIFLDIEMPKLNGLDFLRSILNPPKVIIISGYSNYAIDGFNLNVVDYLLKPVSVDRFLQAINKFKSLTSGLKAKNEMIGKLSLRDNKKVYNFPFNEILFIESDREYVKVNTHTSTKLIKCALSRINEALPEDVFIRVHKSFIISIKCVDVYSATFVEIKGKKIPIGRNYRSAVVKRLDKEGLFLQ
jgi:DNA-binding LytR/AlgR family response regulator